MSTPTIDPPAGSASPPKQSDFSKVSQSAVNSWMEGLKEGALASAPTDTQSNTTPSKEVEPAPPAPTSAAPEPKSSDAPTNPPEKSTETEADRWPRSAKDWSKFIAVRDENYKKRDSRIKELESKLTETEKALKALPTDPAAFETIKSERERFEAESKDLSERLRLAAIESHPKFKAYYDGKVNAQVDIARRVVGPEKADAIAEALRMADGAWKSARLEELSMDLSAMQASRLGSVLNAIEEIDTERKGEVARAKTDFETAQAKASAAANAAREQSAAKANARFDAIVKQAADPQEGIPLFQTRDGDESWNKAVQARIDGARQTLFGTNGNADTLIRKAIAAEAFPALLESYNTLLAQTNALKEQVAKLSSASPTIESRPAASGGQGAREPLKPGSRPMEVAADWMRGLQQS